MSSLYKLGVHVILMLLWYLESTILLEPFSPTTTTCRYCVTKCYTVYTIDMYTGTQVLANVACVMCMLRMGTTVQGERL